MRTRPKLKAQIRPVELDDLTQTQQIAIQTFQETYAHETGFSKCSMDEIFAMDTIRSWITQPDNICLGVFIEGQMAGYAVVVCEAHQATLDKMYLRQSAQGNGLGRMLMIAVYEQLKLRPHIEDIQAIVWEHNQSAIKFYQKMGFAKTDIQVYYPYSQADNPTFDDVMVKSIRPDLTWTEDTTCAP